MKMSGVKRLTLTALGTVWVFSVVVLWILAPSLLGLDATIPKEGGGGWSAYWTFGWLGSIILSAVPFGIYMLLGLDDND